MSWFIVALFKYSCVRKIQEKRLEDTENIIFKGTKILLKQHNLLFRQQNIEVCVGYCKIVDRILYELTFPLIFLFQLSSTLDIISTFLEFLPLC